MDPKCADFDHGHEVCRRHDPELLDEDLLDGLQVLCCRHCGVEWEVALPEYRDE